MAVYASRLRTGRTAGAGRLRPHRLQSLSHPLSVARHAQTAGILQKADQQGQVGPHCLHLLRAGAEGTPDGVGADRELCRKLVSNVLEASKESDEKVDLVARRSVEKFKNEHPDWYKMEPKTIGDFFKADYVVWLEMEQFDLLESGGLMYRGRTQINVQLQDMHDAVGDPEPLQIFKLEYPKRGPIPVDDTNIASFRSKFLDVIARELSWMFIEHSTGSGFAEE